MKDYRETKQRNFNLKKIYSFYSTYMHSDKTSVKWSFFFKFYTSWCWARVANHTQAEVQHRFPLHLSCLNFSFFVQCIVDCSLFVLSLGVMALSIFLPTVQPFKPPHLCIFYPTFCVVSDMEYRKAYSLNIL